MPPWLRVETALQESGAAQETRWGVGGWCHCQVIVLQTKVAAVRVVASVWILDTVKAELT